MIVVKFDTGALDWLTFKIMSKQSCLNLAQFHLTALSVSLRPIMTLKDALIVEAHCLGKF